MISSNPNNKMLRLTTLIFLFCAVPSVHAADPSSLRKLGARVEVNAVGQESIYAAGAKVTVNGTVVNGIHVAGADVVINAKAGDGLWLLASSANVKGEYGGPVNIWSAKTVIDAVIKASLSIAAADVHIGRSTTIATYAGIAAAEVNFEGAAQRQVTIAADTLRFAGTAGGGVELKATSVTITSDARINGDAVIYTIGQPTIEDGAQITGKVIRKSLPEAVFAERYSAGPFAALLPLLILALSAFLAGIAHLWFGRQSVEDTIDAFVEHPLTNGLIGIGTIVLMFVVAALMILSIFAAPFGIAGLITLPILALLGVASAGFGFGEWLLNRSGEPCSVAGRGLFFVAGLIIVTALGMVPFAGPLLLFLAMLMGIGALVRSLHARLSLPVPL